MGDKMSLSSKVVLVALVALGVWVYITAGGLTPSRDSGSGDNANKNFVPTVDDVREVLGTIVSIDSDRITLDVSKNPVVKDSVVSPTRTVSISNRTLFLALELKSNDEYSLEMSAYNDAVSKNGSATQAPPSIFKETKSSRTQIKPGMLVSISSEENILNRESFVASKVSLLPPPNTKVGD